jgi:hypothetical protein
MGKLPIEDREMAVNFKRAQGGASQLSGKFPAVGFLLIELSSSLKRETLRNFLNVNALYLSIATQRLCTIY